MKEQCRLFREGWLERMVENSEHPSEIMRVLSSFLRDRGNDSCLVVRTNIEIRALDRKVLAALVYIAGAYSEKDLLRRLEEIIRELRQELRERGAIPLADECEEGGGK